VGKNESTGVEEKSNNSGFWYVTAAVRRQWRGEGGQWEEEWRRCDWPRG